jgi:dipeptidyl aminopeptidase/acylaminoacyl peptidase
VELRSKPENEIWVAAASGNGGLTVTSCGLDGGESRKRAHHDTADEVVFDAAGVPRFWFERSGRRSERGVAYDLVQIVGRDGATRGAPFRQVDWIRHSSPRPRFGDGPITMLGGGELAWWGTAGERGFVPVAPLHHVWGDASRVVVDPDTGALDAIGWYAERLHWEGVENPTVIDDLHWLTAELGGDVDVVERAAEDRWWVVSTWSGSAWERYVLFNRATRGLFPVDAADVRPQLAEVLPLTLRARDGMTLATYLTTPDETRWGPPPWPLVVQVHGGPWAGRHTWYPDEDANVWADRGYATLAVNFRGTHGFGWKKTHGVEGAYGRGMVNDVDDAITWAIDGGWAEPDRIAVVGASYGGSTALWLATAAEPRLACAVAGVVRGTLMVPGGALNIESVADRTWREEHSPDRHTDRLRAPVFVWTGGRDGDNSDDRIEPFVANARRDDKEITWVRFPWEGHGFENPNNLAALRVITDRFLGACLGGPSWNWPAEWGMANLEVLAGAEHVPGLAERLTLAR